MPNFPKTRLTYSSVPAPICANICTSGRRRPRRAGTSNRPSPYEIFSRLLAVFTQPSFSRNPAHMARTSKFSCSLVGVPTPTICASSYTSNGSRYCEHISKKLWAEPLTLSKINVMIEKKHFSRNHSPRQYDFFSPAPSKRGIAMVGCC